MNIAYNMDCMEYMRSLPDKAFDLAVVDPPYGIGVDRQSLGAGTGVSPQGRVLEVLRHGKKIRIVRPAWCPYNGERRKE